MLARRSIEAGPPDDFYKKSLAAYDKVVIAFAKVKEAHVDDIGLAMFRRDQYRRYVERDAGLSWQEVLYAGSAFSATLRTHERHPFKDNDFVSFLVEQATFAAVRDGILVEKATMLHPQLPAANGADASDLPTQIIDAVEQNLLAYGGDENMPVYSPVRTTYPKREPTQISRRTALKWMGWGSLTAVLVGTGFVGHKHERAEYWRTFEEAHKMTSKLTPPAAYSNVQFGYPQVTSGQNPIYNYGEKAIISFSPSDNGTMQVALPWDNSNFPNKKINYIQGVSIGTYQDSTGKLVPRIKYEDTKRTTQEYALLGHITEPEGSFSWFNPDVVIIQARNNDPLYASIVIEETQERNGEKKRLVKVTTVELTPQ